MIETKEFFQVELLLKTGEIRSLLIRPTSGPSGSSAFGRVHHDASDRMVKGVTKIFFRSEVEREDAGYHRVPNAVVGPAFGQSARSVMRQVSREITGPGKKPGRSARRRHDPAVGTRL